jgi:predicted lipoprotein with Yx(FWY)xxD motif
MALMVATCAGTGAASAASAAGPANSSVRTVSSATTGSSSTTLKTRKINGVVVLTNAKGFTLYWFAPDTTTKSNCNGSCAAIWPPVKGPATAGSGVTGKLGTIKRSDGSTQATYNGHPLYTYVADTAPGQARGNGLNVNGGLWHEVTVSG